MALSSILPHELKPGEWIIYKLVHYRVTDDVKVGLPAIGYVSVATEDRAGIKFSFIFEASERVNVVTTLTRSFRDTHPPTVAR